MQHPHTTHTRHHAPHPHYLMRNVLARWAILISIAIGAWGLGHLAHAESAHGMGHMLYTASFDWKGAAYRFTIGTQAHQAPGLSTQAKRSRFVALIASAKGEPVARCERQLLAEAPLSTDMMTLRCEGSLFSPAAATVRFNFSDKLDHPTLTLWGAPRAIGTVVALRSDAAEGTVIAGH